MDEYIKRDAAIDSVKAEMKYRGGTLDYNAGLLRATENLEILPAADVVEEENILKFYYVRSIDEYWIGQRIDNFYYAEYDPKSRQWVWTHSRYLPWGEHVVSPTSLWKEHTYPSEPEEIPFAEWLQGFIKKHAADVVEFVRCKDCKYYQNSAGNCDDDACPISYRCDRLNKHMFESDYCSFGERKEGTPL